MCDGQQFLCHLCNVFICFLFGLLWIYELCLELSCWWRWRLSCSVLTSAAMDGLELAFVILSEKCLWLETVCHCISVDGFVWKVRVIVLLWTWQSVSEVKDHIIAMDMDMIDHTAFIVTHVNNTWQISKQTIRDSPNTRKRRQSPPKVWSLALSVSSFGVSVEPVVCIILCDGWVTWYFPTLITDKLFKEVQWSSRCHFCQRDSLFSVIQRSSTVTEESLMKLLILVITCFLWLLSN